MFVKPGEGLSLKFSNSNMVKIFKILTNKNKNIENRFKELNKKLTSKDFKSCLLKIPK